MTPRHQFALILVLLAVSLFFWDSVFLYPVKLFVVLLHELSHGAAAVATGGSIERIEINEMIGGACYTRGGWAFVVVSSGYLGSMALGGALFLLGQKRAAARALGIAIGIGVPALTLLFVRTWFGIGFGLLFGGAMLAAVRFFPEQTLRLALQYLGAASALYALVDIREDVLTLSPRLTDASILSGMTGIPAIVWGILWALLGLAVFAAIMWKAYRTATASHSDGSPKK